jgi:hypothetical protein
MYRRRTFAHAGAGPGSHEGVYTFDRSNEVMSLVAAALNVFEKRE